MWVGDEGGRVLDGFSRIFFLGSRPQVEKVVRAIVAFVWWDDCSETLFILLVEVS